MQKTMILSFLHILLLLFPNAAKASIGIGIGVGIGIGNGGAGANTPLPSRSNLNNAYTALQAWKSSITDDPLKILDTWIGPNVCSYKGIFCDTSDTPFVAGIDLNHANLQGTLVKELSLLSDITLIHLNSNKFSGTVPDTFKDFTFLQELDLSNNQLSGCIPQGVGIFTEMQVLDVSFNSLVGHLPDTISCLQDIEVLNLGHNKLSGDISDVIYNCIPGKNMQRPSPECSVIPDVNLNCLRIPTPKPLVCGTLASGAYNSKYTNIHSSSP
ncbi:hypothetical protein TSUD_75050 [Trifolium subterraneum]|nr:hypothetical protein TSUD_75050 [Trifolium subterraneum]